MKAIEVRGLSMSYGDKLALDSVTFEVQEGRFFGCFGPNGAGKSTLLRLLTGQIRPSAGQATVLGVDCATQGLEVKKLIGIVPEVESPGAFVGGFLFEQFGSTGTTGFSIWRVFVAVTGAVVLLVAIRLLTGRRRLFA